MISEDTCKLNIKELDLENSEIFIKPHKSSKRKTKSRVLPIGKATKSALWHYLASRLGTDDSKFIWVASD